MGMFDTVIFFCPYCTKEIEEQSKTGECKMKQFHQNRVPVSTAVGLIDIKIVCPICDKAFKIVGDISSMSMRLIDYKEENSYD